MTENRHIGRYIGRLYNLMRRRLWKDTAGLECTGTELKILSILLCAPKPMLQKDIEEEFFLRPPTATDLLKKMERNGLIVRVHEDGDARRKRIIPTEKSLSAKNEVLSHLENFERDITYGIPEEDLRLFCLTAEKMLENLSSTTDLDKLEENG